MKNKHIEILEEIQKYLKLRSPHFYEQITGMLEEIKEEKARRNKYKLDKITEKRKIDPSYGGHYKRK